MSKRLYRSDSDKLISGVCGGLAEYFNIDPVFIRLIFILITIMGGSGFLVYIVLWVILPNQTNLNATPNQTIHDNSREIGNKVESLISGSSRYVLGSVLIIFGFSLLINNFFPFLHLLEIEKVFWPLVIILLGLVVTYRGIKDGK